MSVIEEIAGYKLYPYQREGVDFLLGRKYCLLADDMGLGKTIQALWALAEQAAAKILIVCPASLQFQWEEATRVFFPSHYIEVMGKNPVAFRHYSKAILIASYSRAGLKDGRDRLKELQFDTTILDEAHFIKNPQAKRTKNLLGKGSFLSNSRSIWLMTGTPILNRPAEVYMILKCFAPERLGKYLPWPIFVRKFCGYQGKGATHTAELERILAGFFLRRTQEQVFRDLPPIIEQVVHVPNISDPDNEYLPTRRRMVSVAKIPFALEYLKDLLQTIDKLIVVAYHTETIETFRKELPNSIVLKGGMTNTEKTQALESFKTGGSNILIGQISVLGYGIDGLQDVCNHMVFAELDWSPGTIEQTKDRIYRIRQKKPAHFHYLIAKGTIEEDIDLTLDWKRQVIQSLVKETNIGKEYFMGLAEEFAELVAIKVLEKLNGLHGPATVEVKVDKPKPHHKKEKAEVAAIPEVLTGPQVDAILAEPVQQKIDRIKLKEQEGIPFRTKVLEAGVTKEQWDKWNHENLLAGLSATLITNMTEEEVIEYAKRLRSNDPESVAQFILGPKTVDEEM